MTLDPELAPLLDALPPTDLEDILGTRQAHLRARASMPPAWPHAAITVTYFDTIIPVATRTEGVRVRVYTPRGRTTDAGVLVFMHGGAFVFGDLESEHGRCAEYADRAGCIVVSVDYRLAPEHPYPAALDDCLEALRWVVATAQDLGGDPARIGVGGASAGGALAACLAIRNRDEIGLNLRLQLLVYPVIGSAISTPSMACFYDYPAWSGRKTERMWRLYLDGAASPPGSASPARAESLEGLPPTYVLAADHDPLRDEDLDYARRLVAAGVSTELHLFAGAFHGFDVLAPDSALGRRALDEQVRFLERNLSLH